MPTGAFAYRAPTPLGPSHHARWIRFGGQPPTHLGAVFTGLTACGLKFEPADMEPPAETRTIPYEEMCPTCHEYIVQDQRAQLEEEHVET